MLSEEELLQTLRQVVDPELGVNVVDLGLVYGTDIQEGQVGVTMTMTTPACPLGAYIKQMAEAAILSSFPETETVDIQLVWSPPWQPDMMSAAAKRELGWA
jgi:metal-sulfur cluster biosynthetic enzyme